MLFPFKLVCSGTKWKRIRYHGNIPSWRRFQGLSQDVLKTSCKTKNCYAEDVFKTSWRHVLKTSWRDVLKTYWRHTLKTSSRRLGGKQNFYWWYLYLTNLNVYLTNLCFTNLYLTNLGRMRHLEPNNFDIRLILKHTSISILRIKISEASEARKKKF